MVSREMTGSEIVLKALVDQGVDTVFGYPGGAVLPIYDAIFTQNACATSWCARRAARCTWRRATPGRPARSAWSSSPRVPGRPTPSPGSPTP